MQDNPYFHIGPIRSQQYFYGRAHETRLALRLLRNGQCVSVVGPRRIGKTSFLLHVSNPETWKHYGFDPSRIHMIHIDCEGLSGLPPEALYEALGSEILAQLPDISYLTKVVDTDAKKPYFRLRSIIHEFRVAADAGFMVLLFDEFETLARNPHSDDRFFSALRSLHTNYSVRYVLATSTPLHAPEAGFIGSPFFNIFQQIMLGLFHDKEAFELIAHPAETVGMPFPSEVTKFIHDLAGGHPFMLQVACFYAFEILASKGRFDGDDYATLEAMVTQDQLEPHFEYYWSHLSDEERLVLAKLSTREFTPSFLKHTAHVLRELESKALIVVQDSSYVPFSSAFAEFVRDRAGRYSVEMGEVYTSLGRIQAALDLESQRFLRQAREFVERLCQRLDFGLLSQSSLPDSRLSLFALNTKGFFHGIRLPNTLPLLFLQRDKLLEGDLDEIRQYLSDEMGTAHRIALLALLGREPAAGRARKMLFDKLRQVYAYDVILLSADDLLSINFAEDPARELRKEILAHVDLVTTSPFIITGPTTDDVFFGREHELREIADSVGFSSFAVIGGRRIGKSSLLGRLHRVRLPAAGFLTACHDCSTTPGYEDFLTTPIRDWCPEPPSDAPATLGELIQSAPGDKPFVLLLDEADKLIPADRANNWRLFNALRALATSGHAQFLLSGERTLRDALRDPISPLFNFANEMLLGLLDFGAVEELVTRPMKQLEIEMVNEKAIVDSIWAFTSGHPNVVQRLCHRLVERLNEQSTRRIAVDDVNAVIEAPQFQEVDFLQTYWEAASPLEKVITLLLSREDRACRLKEVRRLLSEQAGIQPSATATKDALDRLVDLRSVLKRSQAGYAFAVEAFPRVLANTTTVEDLLEVLVEQYEQTEAQA
jgi:hypothetical protein